jgi:hypothetical protein
VGIARLWAFLAVALPTMAALIAGLSSVDLAYHLRAGAGILDTGSIPSADSWTFTATGLPWTDQQWGVQVILAAVFRAGGWTGLVLMRGAVVAFTFASLFVVARRRGLAERRAALLTLAAFLVSAPALALRPQLFGMALFALTLLLVTQRHARPRWLWAVPIVAFVWANLHGSFFLAPLVLALAWLEDVLDHRPAARSTLLVGLSSVVAASATPFGPAVWAYAAGLTSNPSVTSRITEWQPTSIRDIAGFLFFGSVMAVFALIARQGTRVPWPTLAWLATFLVIGAYAERGAAWWSLAMVPAVGSLISPAVEHDDRSTPRLRRLNAVVAVLIILVGVSALPVWRPADTGLETPAGVIIDAPSGVTASVRSAARPGDRLFNSQSWGSWFEFAIPSLPVAVDSRIEMIPAEVWDAYETVISGGEGWQTILARWKVTLAALDPTDTATATRLSDIGWTRLFADGTGSVYRAP